MDDKRYHVRFVIKWNLFFFYATITFLCIPTVLLVLMANVKLGRGPYLLLQRAKLPSRIRLVWGWNSNEFTGVWNENQGPSIRVADWFRSNWFGVIGSGLFRKCLTHFSLCLFHSIFLLRKLSETFSEILGRAIFQCWKNLETLWNENSLLLFNFISTKKNSNSISKKIEQWLTIV